eukprot:575884-Pyramimonas_sp.AAC.1
MCRLKHVNRLTDASIVVSLCIFYRDAGSYQGFGLSDASIVVSLCIFLVRSPPQPANSPPLLVISPHCPYPRIHLTAPAREFTAPHLPVDSPHCTCP